MAQEAIIIQNALCVLMGADDDDDDGRQAVERCKLFHCIPCAEILRAIVCYSCGPWNPSHL